MKIVVSTLILSSDNGNRYAVSDERERKADTVEKQKRKLVNARNDRVTEVGVVEEWPAEEEGNGYV